MGLDLDERVDPGIEHLRGLLGIPEVCPLLSVMIFHSSSPPAYTKLHQEVWRHLKEFVVLIEVIPRIIVQRHSVFIKLLIFERLSMAYK